MKRTAKAFPVVIQPDVSGGYWASCPMLSGCYSQGETLEKTLNNIREAISLCLEDLSPAQQKTLTQDISVHVVTI